MKKSLKAAFKEAQEKKVAKICRISVVAGILVALLFLVIKGFTWEFFVQSIAVFVFSSIVLCFATFAIVTDRHGVIKI